MEGIEPVVDIERPDGLWKGVRLAEFCSEANAVGSLEMLAQRVAGGEGLVGICRSLMLPHGRVLLWLMQDVERWQVYMRALRASGFVEADEAKEIADAAEDTRERIGVRKWRAAKHAPDVYGDKVQLQTPVNPGAVVDAALEFMARGLLDKMRVVSTQGPRDAEC